MSRNEVDRSWPLVSRRLQLLPEVHDRAADGFKHRSGCSSGRQWQAIVGTLEHVNDLIAVGEPLYGGGTVSQVRIGEFEAHMPAADLGGIPRGTEVTPGCVQRTEDLRAHCGGDFRHGAPPVRMREFYPFLTASNSLHQRNEGV